MTFPAELISAIRAHYALPWTGIHGIIHWARVMENGRRLATKTGANLRVVELFALFHDAGRVNENTDRHHGQRGADIARSYRGKYIHLPKDDFDLLCHACCHHADGHTDGDITVQTCWDADRLDLGRVGKVVRQDRLCTAAAKDRSLIAWADRQARAGIVPAFARGWLDAKRLASRPKS